MKGKWITIFFVLLLPILLPGCGGANRNANEKTITVFNAGEYIDPETLKIFERQVLCHTRIMLCFSITLHMPLKTFVLK